MTRSRRLSAIGALLSFLATLVAVAAVLWGDLGRALLVLVLLLAAVGLAWSAVTHRGPSRLTAAALAVLGLAAAVVVVVTGDGHGLLAVTVVVLVAVSASLTRYALGHDPASLAAADTPGEPVGPSRHGVLIMNLKSGGGKAERFDLEGESRRRGIEPVVLRPGDDLRQLAQDAIDRGADVLGMAGGDGSQALVASVAMDAGVAMVCIPAGTRNHFALDLGLDREDVVGALDAYADAVERRIDLATVGDRVFVNNVSLGIYAKVVQSPEYRDAKRQTTASLLPELLGPEADPFDLRYPGPDGTERSGAQIIMVSNNPYRLTGLGGVGSRARLDTGTLGIVTAEVHGAAEMAELVAAEAAGRIQRFRGYAEWATPTFAIQSDEPVEAGVDGEALVFDAPLEFRSLPGALRVRLPAQSWGRSPAALKPSSLSWTVRALALVARGREAPVDGG
jgi:diacylglycerol kinase family enzyme